MSEASLSHGSSQLRSWRGEDEGRNEKPNTPLGSVVLNLEHRGSARVFFHLKLNLFPFVLHCALQGSGS